MVVVDVSLAAKWIFPEVLSELATLFLADHTHRSETLIAPVLFRHEITNVVRQRVRRGEITASESPLMLARFLAFPVEIRPLDRLAQVNLHGLALDVANRCNLSATYDAHYVALAALNECDLWTADQRLIRELGGAMPFVRWLGDYVPRP